MREPVAETKELDRRARPFITLVLHKFSRGGSDRVAAYLAQGFVRAGFKVELVVFARGGEVERVLLDLLGEVPVRFLGKAGTSRALDLLSGLRGFASYLRRERPDVVLSTANNTSLISAAACVLANLRQARLVLKTTNPIASSRHRGWIRRLRLWSYRWVFKRTACVWTLSEEESAEMRAEFPEFANLFRAVAQPYVTPAMKPVSRAGSHSPNPTILSVARLTKQKRLDRLIRAFAKLHTRDARLLVLGEGEDRRSLEALARELGVSERIQMPGYVPDVAAALSKADLFVLTSDYEGLPAAVIEAMAANCPVLSTDCFPSARSLLAGGEGCELIEQTCPIALAQQIDRLLSRPRPTRLARNVRGYSIENGVASHLDALRLVLSVPTPRDCRSSG